MGKHAKRARRLVKKTIRLRDVKRDQQHRDKRISVDPVNRLIQSARTAGKPLTVGEEQAAREIPRIYALVVQGLAVRAQNLESARGGSGETGLDRIDKWHPDHVWAYLNQYRPWANTVEPVAKSVTIDYLAQEIPLLEIDRAHKWRNGTAAQIIRATIASYASIAGWSR
jgi:hypothetical protein